MVNVCSQTGVWEQDIQLKTFRILQERIPLLEASESVILSSSKREQFSEITK